MGMLKSLLDPRLRLLAQQREIAALRAELGELRAQVDSMKSGMRRCLSCDYRIAFKAAQDRAADGLDAAPAATRPSAGEP
jgi:hypothetical protein